MATVVQPRRDDNVPRPNVPSAGNRLPGVRDYEQVDRDIIGTLRPTLGWFAALGTAVLCLRMAQMELRRMIHGLSDREYDALCETMGWLSCNPRGDLAS